MCGVPGFVTYRGYSLEEARASVGPGWSRLIEQLFSNKPEQTLVVQVKEKFGGLRFYVSSSTPEFFEVINNAEKESYRICEQCGSPGTPQTPGGNPYGWVKTVCISCGGEGGYKAIEEEK
jgi:hypothetical protein